MIDVEAAVELELVEGGLDGFHSVEDGFVAFADPDGCEGVVRDEVIEQGAIADVFVGLGGGEVGFGG